MIRCEQQCESGHKSIWRSQPSQNRMPLGNILLAATLFFHAVNPTKVLRSLMAISLAVMTPRVYWYIQRSYLVPSVLKVWQEAQNVLLSQRKERGVKLGGDARCCSPGHSATYSSYTLMDMEDNKVLDIQLVMVNETVGNSYAMEVESLQRGLKSITDAQLHVTDIVTDRHSSVKKFLREHHPEINHWFDVWHVGKGIQKKLLALSKKRKDLNMIGLWTKSIVNHVYWVAASSAGNKQLATQKWTSILRHVCNIHGNHGDIFTQCDHGPMGPDDRQWFQKESRQFHALEGIVANKLLLKDIGHLSPHVQTSSVEAFHSLICHFAPKFFNYSYLVMKAKLMLAALQFNENGDRECVWDEEGEPKVKISFTKAKGGEATIRSKKESMTFGYAQSLLDQVLAYREQYPSIKLTSSIKCKEPRPTLARRFEPPNKKQLTEGYKSRFKKSIFEKRNYTAFSHVGLQTYRTTVEHSYSRTCSSRRKIPL